MTRRETQQGSSSGADWRDGHAWSPERLVAAIEFLTRRVEADFEEITATLPGRPLVMRPDLAWADDSRVPGTTPGPEDVIAVLFDGQHEFPAGLEDGVEYACFVVADRMQDDVIDMLGRPWPELFAPSGESMGVLDPRYAGGLALWTLRGEALCAIGQLVGAVAAAGLGLVNPI